MMSLMLNCLLSHDRTPYLHLTFGRRPQGYDDIVALLLEKGAPVNCRVTEDASTPLHKACAGSKSGHLAAATLLLANNADVHALNKWRETPLLTAANHGQAGTVDALLKAGADPCKCTDTGWSPLSIAAYKGHDDVVKLLLEEGAPTEEADPTLSALLQAATKGLPDTVELLLRHGADHTVTTKKGDTALSILVEQNLIDAAADMVTEYNASIPRCSRDRKKVQRARLLVNLKIKQRQREGRDVKTIDTDDDESDQELNIFAAAEDNPEIDESAAIEAISTKKNKNRNNKKKISAEQQAKAAEEALLAELEMEDAERQKQEDEANKKSAKKRKKKERERQLKKEQEQKLLEQENERQEKLRKEREAREAKERAERDRLAAIKLKEEEEERKRVIEQQKVELAKREEERKKEFEKWKQQQKQESSVAAKPKLPAQAATKTPKVQPVAVATPLTSRATNPSRAPQSTKAMQGRVVGSIAKPASKAAGKNRGWETKPLASQLVLGDEATQTPSKPFAAHSDLTAGPSNFLTPSRDISGQPESYRRSASSPFSSFGGEMMNPPAPGPLGFAKSEPILNGFSSNSPVLGKRVEVPAVALFRRSKVSELLQRIAAARMSGEALGTINEATIKKVLYRWMVRAAHETATHWDCIIPSWTDFEKLTAFFQRQFISESRKRFNSSLGSSTVGMESLKEAGTAIAVLCHGLAKEVSEFCSRVEEQLPHDWNDAIIGMKASDLVRNGSVHQVSVVVDWANRAQVFLPAFAFNKLQQRYVGIPGRLLSTIFSTQIRYETQQLVTADTMMDFRLSAETLAILTSKAQISGEVWSNPMTAASGSIYWGQFVDVDNAFGGLAPFSSEERSEEILSRHGGSVVVTVPLDSMIASMYLNRVLSLLDRAESGMVPLSFVIFLRSESFLDGPENPSFNDLCAVEPRLREHADYFSHIKELPSRQHGYFCTRNNRFEISETGSLVVVLQNASGRALYGISEMVMGELLRSMSADLELSQTSQDQRNLPLMSEMSFSAPEFVPASKINSVGDDSASNFFNHAPVHARTPISPVSAQPRNILPDFGAPIGGGDFGGFGVGSIGGAFGSAAGSRSSRPARGRLFDLVDDGAEDETADVVSGMLGNLNMDDLFSRQPNRNSMGEIDIEAISLMGIGGPVPSSSSSGGLQPRRGPFGY
jgi:ankyrin repeat protein